MKNSQIGSQKDGFLDGYLEWLKLDTKFFLIKSIPRFWTLIIGALLIGIIPYLGSGKLSIFPSTAIWLFILAIPSYMWQRRKELKGESKFTKEVERKGTTYVVLAIIAILVLLMLLPSGS